MKISNIRHFLFTPLLLSLLVHLLLFVLSFFIIFRPIQSIQKQSPAVSPVPAYVYHQAVPPRVQRQRAAKQPVHQTVTESIETVSTAKKINENVPIEKPTVKKSLFFSSLDTLRKNQIQEMNEGMKDSEPIYLVGEETAFADPFIMLLGKALSAHFHYPKMAGELGMRGTVLISFVLHPEGYFSNIQVKRSSNYHDLDAAALYAVNQAPVIKEMHRFIQQPKRLVVGYIFK